MYNIIDKGHLCLRPAFGDEWAAKKNSSSEILLDMITLWKYEINYSNAWQKIERETTSILIAVKWWVILSESHNRTANRIKSKILQFNIFLHLLCVSDFHIVSHFQQKSFPLWHLVYYHSHIAHIISIISCKKFAISNAVSDVTVFFFCFFSHSRSSLLSPHTNALLTVGLPTLSVL